MLLAESRCSLSLSSLAGDWKQEGVEDYIWTIDQRGGVWLDGDVKYALWEQGEGLNRTITRRNGWQIDIEKSTSERIYWRRPNEADLQWVRASKASPTRDVA